MRDTGPARRRIDGDSEAAAPYVGPARTMLGILENQMRFNELAQGWLTRYMPDGTEIAVRSIFGQQTVSIYGPTTGGEVVDLVLSKETFKLPTEEPPQPSKQPAQTSSLAVCGTCHFEIVLPDAAPIQYDRAFIWQPGQKPVDLGVLPGTDSSFAFAISGNGVVVGECTGGDIGPRAFRWSKGTGMQDLGAIGEGGHYLRATGVSADGHTVAGIGAFDADAGLYGAWVWTQQRGMTALPQAEIQTPAGPIAAKVSPNGKYITGSGMPVQVVTHNVIADPTPPAAKLLTTLTDQYRGVRWFGSPQTGYVPTALPYSGELAKTRWYFAGVTGHAPFDVTETYDLPLMPMNVADTGAVSARAVAAFWVSSAGSVLKMTATGGTPDPVAPSDPFSSVSSAPSSTAAFPVGLTTDGGRSSGSYSSAAFNVEPAVFVWTKGSLVAANFVGQVNDMARDGTAYVGSTGVAGGVDEATQVPMLWSSKGAQKIPLLVGASYGYATGIGSNTIRFDEDGNVKIPNIP